MMEKRGEVHVAGSFGNNGTTMNSGVSLTNNFGVVGSIHSSNFSIESDIERSAKYYDGGITYFRRLGENTKSQFVLGWGKGDAETIDTFTDRMDKGDYTRLFFQANGSYRVSSTEAGASLRLSHVRFTDLESTEDISGLQREDLFIEPAAFLSYGLRNARLESQFGYAFPLSGTSNLAFQYQYIRLSIGARIIID